MENSTITLTFGDAGENHKGMQIIGDKVDEGEGFTYDDLKELKTKFKDYKLNSKLYKLNRYIPESNDIPIAAVLVVKNFIQTILNDTEYTYKNFIEEQLNLEYDKKAFMYGRVVNKNARYNLCFDEKAQEPDYENGKGRIISYKEMKILNTIRKKLNKIIGRKFDNMKCESNYYYDINKTGIGYHGDTERRKVVAIRLGASLPIHYQWFKNNLPKGDNVNIDLDGGDLYIMSEKAVGTDWKSSSIYTLRHATGCDKFTKL
jgi:hypothetical protein